MLFNLSVLHTATIRPTQKDRKTVQIYYGRRDHPDPEVRAFYSVLNPKSRAFAAAFGASAPE